MIYESNSTTAVVEGVGGREYLFSPFPIPGYFYNSASIYIMARRATGLLGSWYSPLYIGEADRLYTRLLNHEKLERAERLGLTHILVLAAPSDKASRIRIETDIRNKYSTPLNDQNSLADALLGQVTGRRLFPGSALLGSDLPKTFF